MIIRIIPVRILILLSLQGKEEICRAAPCSCLAPLVPLGGMLLLGATNPWWGCSPKVCEKQDVVGHQIPASPWGCFVPSIRNPSFSGSHCGCAGFLIHAGRDFSLPRVLGLMKSLGCCKTSRDVLWSEPGIELGCARKLPGLVGAGPRMCHNPTVTPQQRIQCPQVSPWTI